MNFCFVFVRISFHDGNVQQNVVKLQILNLATKLIITNPKQAKILSQYVFRFVYFFLSCFLASVGLVNYFYSYSLAKYDQNYDIRDRARFLRHLVFPEDGHAGLAKYAKKIFLASKPAPIIVSIFKGIAVIIRNSDLLRRMQFKN